jgi:hypothetical protein
LKLKIGFGQFNLIDLLRRFRACLSFADVSETASIGDFDFLLEVDAIFANGFEMLWGASEG